MKNTNGVTDKVMTKKTFTLYLIVMVLLMSSCKASMSHPGNVENNNEYMYEIIDDTVEIINHYYDEDELYIIVPEKIEDKPVTILGADSFYQHKSTVSIELPNSLISIEGSPFYRCYSLKEITIPSRVKNISSNPFFRSSSLTNITVVPDNMYYSDLNGVLFNKEKTVLIAYPEGREEESYTVPTTVEKLNIDSFGYQTKLNTLTILSNVTDFPENNMFVFPDKIKLIVESGSAAEQYAIENDLSFELLY